MCTSTALTLNPGGPQGYDISPFFLYADDIGWYGKEGS